jgi:hypothetical protein
MVVKLYIWKLAMESFRHFMSSSFHRKIGIITAAFPLKKCDRELRSFSSHNKNKLRLPKCLKKEAAASQGDSPASGQRWPRWVRGGGESGPPSPLFWCLQGYVVPLTCQGASSGQVSYYNSHDDAEVGQRLRTDARGAYGRCEWREE